jgi:hypothetical protein
MPVPGQLGGFFIWSNCASPTAMYDVLPLLRTLMPYTAILKQIRLLVPAKLDEHYESIRRGFEDGTLTAPRLSISQMQLARAISEFTSFPPNEASIETLQRRLNPKH